jgi:hypothetical protein
MHAIKLLWFFFWRMVLRGLALGAGLGTVYGLLVGGITFPYGVGFLIVGPFYGTVGRLFLGVVTVKLLWGLMLSLAHWLLHGCPDPNALWERGLRR